MSELLEKLKTIVEANAVYDLEVFSHRDEEDNAKCVTADDYADLAYTIANDVIREVRSQILYG